MNLARIENELGNPNNFDRKRDREDYERACYQAWVRLGESRPAVDAFPLTAKAFKRAQRVFDRHGGLSFGRGEG